MSVPIPPSDQVAVDPDKVGRTAQIIVGALAMGLIVFASVAIVLRWGKAPENPFIAYFAAGFSALVLAVETFAECEDLWARGRWAVRGPLVEAAACAVLEGGGGVRYAVATAPAALETLARRRAGETLACEPLVGLALARDAGEQHAALTGQWRGRRTAVTLGLPAATGAAAHA